MRLALGATVLATATACGGKKAADPYATSLALGSEHVEFVAVTTLKSKQERVVGSGDFINEPDRGHYTFTVRGKSQKQVFANGRLYVYAFGDWLSQKVSAHTPQTPAQMFRAHLPAKIENGLVRSITIHGSSGYVTYDFSNYGEQVSVTVPRVKGFK